MIKTGKIGGVLFSIYGSCGIECAGLVEDRIYPEDRGSLTKLVGCSYPFKGYPSGMIMRQLNVSKDSSWLILEIFKNKLLIFLAILGYVFFRRFAKRYFIRLCESYFKLAYEPLKKQDFIPKEHEWCMLVKELYRMSEELFKRIKGEQLRAIFSKFRDIALMIIEMDTAYRFVMQDILPEIDVEEVKRHTVKEIQRVFKILQEREIPGDQRNKWIRVEKKIIPILRISRRAKKWLVRFLSGLDYNKIKLDEADWYFCLQTRHYNYRGLSNEDRLKEKERIDIEKKHFIPKLKIVEQPQPHLEIVK